MTDGTHSAREPCCFSIHLLIIFFIGVEASKQIHVNCLWLTIHQFFLWWNYCQHDFPKAPSKQTFMMTSSQTSFLIHVFNHSVFQLTALALQVSASTKTDDFKQSQVFLKTRKKGVCPLLQVYPCQFFQIYHCRLHPIKGIVLLLSTFQMLCNVL